MGDDVDALWEKLKGLQGAELDAFVREMNMDPAELLAAHKRAVRAAIDRATDEASTHTTGAVEG